MKKLILTLAIIFVSLATYSQVTINKKDCTITKNGKTFPLKGRVKIVESFPDIEVRFVESFPDVEIRRSNNSFCQCGEYIIVDAFPDIRVKIVDHFPDIEVRETTSFPGIVRD